MYGDGTQCGKQKQEGTCNEGSRGGGKEGDGGLCIHQSFIIFPGVGVVDDNNGFLSFQYGSMHELI